MLYPQEMMYRGCERSVITYSSLISACEKAGQVGPAALPSLTHLPQRLRYCDAHCAAHRL